MPGHVALTGATGFIGRAVLEALSARGYTVRALTRKPLADSGTVHWITGDLNDPDALRRLVAGAGAVIHCAGRVRGARPADFRHTNVEGTRNVAEAAAAGSPRTRFLLISSLAAREPRLSWYAASKRGAEEILAGYDDTLPWAAFRPTAVYGPGDRELGPLLRITRYGILPMAGRKNTRLSLIHVDDLVAAILAWLSLKDPLRGIYELDDGTPGGYDHHTLAGIAGRVWDRSVRPLALPEGLVFMTASANLLLARLFHYSPMLTPGKVRELLHQDWVCDNTPLSRDLGGWRPRIRLAEALRTSV